MQNHGMNVGSFGSNTPPSKTVTPPTQPVQGTLNTGADTDSRRAEKTLELGGHSITHRSDFMEFECVSCDTEFAVPEIFQASTDFRAVLYQMYIFAHFKKNECPEQGYGKSPVEQLKEMKNEPRAPNPDNVYWFSGDEVAIDTGDGHVVTDSEIVYESTDDNFTPGQTLTEKEFMDLATGYRKF